MKKSYLWDAIKAALEAGKGIMEVYTDPKQDFQIERKSDHSPLTIADKVSNDIITRYLENTPYPILSEEGKTIDYSIRKDWHDLWIIDPLDGTKEFIKRNGEFTVNIALVSDGKPVMGVIYLPVLKELYYGDLQLGAFKMSEISSLDSYISIDELLVASQQLPLAKSHDAYIVVASRSHLSPETENFINDLTKEHGTVELISSGSSIKICLVAEGSADIYPRFAPTMEWDTAAGNAIALAAGKIITQQDGITPLCYNKEDLLNPWFIVKDAKDCS